MVIPNSGLLFWATLYNNINMFDTLPAETP